LKNAQTFRRISPGRRYTAEATTKNQRSLARPSIRLKKKICVPVIVTRSKLETESLPVKAGDSDVVGLTALRVLPNFTLATERATRTVEMRT
jgi:hypothetical protein